MATETFMALFNKNKVESAVLSEADAVTYKLEMGGATNVSPLPYIKRNGVDFLGTTLNGLNLRSINTPTDAGEVKSFELTPNDTSMNTSFETYMNTSTAKLILIVSGPGLKSSPSVDAWFNKAGSVNWPGNWLANRYSCGYAAIYMPSRKKIVHEILLSTDGTDKDHAKLTAIYDELDDLGVLGFPTRVVYDDNEYSSNNAYEYKRFPTDSAISSMATWGLGPGATVCLSADLIQNSTMTANGMKTRINLRWFKGITILDASTVLEVEGNEFKGAEAYSTAPEGADGFAVVVSRYPRNDSVIGTSAVKNVCLVEVSRDASKINSSAFIGVNGIKASKIVEMDPGNKLMEMNLGGSSFANIVPIVGIVERE